MSRIPTIEKSLEYDVEIISGGKVKKTPHKGFEYKVQTDVLRLQRLGNLAPTTQFISERNIIEQRAIKGRKAKEKEMKKIIRNVKRKGFVPRGILPQDVIVTRSRGKKKFKVVDVGNFERIIGGY